MQANAGQRRTANAAKQQQGGARDATGMFFGSFFNSNDKIYLQVGQRRPTQANTGPRKLTQAHESPHSQRSKAAAGGGLETRQVCFLALF
jgi:hypothetical protein